MFLLFLMLFVGCSNPFVPPNTTAILGQPLSLKMGQSAKFDDGLLVTFEDVPTDGRCSSCTASYYAEIDMRLTIPGKAPTLIVIKTPPISQVTGNSAPYRLEFVKLEPQRKYPSDSVNRADYIVTVKISK
jgi:hypothetical protein